MNSAPRWETKFAPSNWLQFMKNKEICLWWAKKKKSLTKLDRKIVETLFFYDSPKLSYFNLMSKYLVYVWLSDVMG